MATVLFPMSRQPGSTPDPREPRVIVMAMLLSSVGSQPPRTPMKRLDMEPGRTKTSTFTDGQPLVGIQFVETSLRSDEDQRQRYGFASSNAVVRRSTEAEHPLPKPFRHR